MNVKKIKKARLPCKCCIRTELSVCSRQAIKDNWEVIQKLIKLHKDLDK